MTSWDWWFFAWFWIVVAGQAIAWHTTPPQMNHITGFRDATERWWAMAITFVIMMATFSLLTAIIGANTHP